MDSFFYGPLLVLGALLLTNITTPRVSSPTQDIYKVEVKLKIGNCSTTKVMTVEAYNNFDAREKAERYARYEIQTSTGRITKIKK